MVNWERVNELKNDIGQDDFAEVFELFLSEVEEALGELATCHLAKELEEKLHFLKGSALNLGFATFSEICGRYETEAANGSAEEVPVAAIAECYRNSKSVFLENS